MQDSARLEHPRQRFRNGLAVEPLGGLDGGVGCRRHRGAGVRRALLCRAERGGVGASAADRGRGEIPVCDYGCGVKLVAKGEAGGPPEELPAGDQVLKEKVTVAVGSDLTLRVRLRSDRFVVVR
jgi:hypothetical protein